jgi:hypothetical protein
MLLLASTPWSEEDYQIAMHFRLPKDVHTSMYAAFISVLALRRSVHLPCMSLKI